MTTSRTFAPDLARRLLAEGPRGTARRIVRRLHARLGVDELDFPLLPGDLADSLRLAPMSAPDVPLDRPLVVGWLCTPPSPGSGGHTTMFRMVSALERSGHRCVIILYDRHRGDPARQAAVIRRCWPAVGADIRSVDDGLADLDVVVATGWASAHVLASRAPRHVHRAYFVQDYEPFFYPRGAEYELAADSYRFGFTHIALGGMVHDRLRDELGVDSVVVPFSCDTSVYRLQNTGPRNGVVLYAKPGVPRRGFRLAALALEEFHRRHPEQRIHLYGDPVPDLRVPAVHHGRLTPAELNELYNQTVVGLAISFTNVTLVAEEMLASGCIPVANDGPDPRAGLESPHVEWAPSTPGGLADALARVVEAADGADRSRRASASVRGDDWQHTGDLVVGAIERLARPALADVAADVAAP